MENVRGCTSVKRLRFFYAINERETPGDGDGPRNWKDFAEDDVFLVGMNVHVERGLLL